MIEKIRKPKKSKNIINYTIYAIIFGMIIVTFVFMVPGLGGGGGVINTAAEVGSTSISLRDYTDQLKRTRAQYGKLFNGEIPSYFQKNLRNQVLQGLVKREVLSQYAKKNNLIVSSIEVADFIRKDIPAFQEDGEFSYDRYSTYLKNTRSTAKKFEDMVSKDIAFRRVYDMLSSSLVKSNEEVKLAKAALNVEVSYSFIKLKSEDLKKAIKISQESIDEFVQDTKSKPFLQEQYKQMEGQFHVPAKVELGYILIKDKEKALNLFKTLTVKNFKEKAKKNSEDPLSKNKGGDLGEITQGSFSPEVEEKAFKMKKDEISAPFKTKLGYVILHLRNLKPKSVKLLEDVKNEVAKTYLQKQGVLTLKNSLAGAAQKESSVFEAAIAKAGLKWSKDEKYSLEAPSLPGIGASEEIVDKLLSLRNNEVYKNIVSFKDSEYFIKLKNLTAKAPKTDVKLAQNDTSQRSNQLIDLMYENERKSLNIKLNQQLLDQ